MQVVLGFTQVGRDPVQGLIHADARGSHSVATPHTEGALTEVRISTGKRQSDLIL